MKCRVRLYQAPLPPDRNSIFPRLSYSGGWNLKYQYDSQIKNVEYKQSFIVKLDDIYALGTEPEASDTWKDLNYLEMFFFESHAGLDRKSNYIPYYIDKIIRNTKNSIIIYATLDVCNFFNLSDLEDNFNDNCLIERTHLNRWRVYYAPNNPYMLPIVDFRKEDFDIPVKYLISSDKITDKQSGKWYAIYYSDPNNTKTGVRCFLVPKTTANYSVKVDSQSSVSIVGDTMYVIRAEDNPNAIITIGTESLTLGASNSREYIFIFNNGGDITAHKYKYAQDGGGNNWYYLKVDSQIDKNNLSNTFASNIQPLIYYTIAEANIIPRVNSAYAYFPFIDYIYNKANVSTSTQTQSITGLDSIPRTNSRIIKIIDLPYFPCNSTTATNLKYQNIVDDFMNINVIEVINDASFEGSPIKNDSYEVDDYLKSRPTTYLVAHDKQYETKFKNSDYDEYDFEYGPYKYTIQPEMYNIDDNNTKLYFDFFYKQAKLKSAFTIEFTNMSYPYKTEFGGLPTVEGDYIISDIDNEIPVYNSEYINYMKNGYNYDKESIARQTTKGAIGMAVGLGGAALGALVGGPVGAAAVVGMGASAVSQMSNIIISKIQAEANQSYKINSYKNSKTAISAVSDLELRAEYQADALYLRKYEISSSLKELLYEYWRLYGYKYNQYGNPATIVNNNKRYRFNYIKLGSVDFHKDFLATYGKYTDLIEEYKNKLLEGITIYYREEIEGNQIACDFEQKYENFEYGLVWEGYNA